MALAVVSLIAGIFAHLALTDIYHGEPDLSLEWNVLRVCALIFLCFIGFALITLGRVSRKI